MSYTMDKNRKLKYANISGMRKKSKENKKQGLGLALSYTKKRRRRPNLALLLASDVMHHDYIVANNSKSQVHFVYQDPFHEEFVLHQQLLKYNGRMHRDMMRRGTLPVIPELELRNNRLYEQAKKLQRNVDYIKLDCSDGYQQGIGEAPLGATYMHTVVKL
jgi:hypothetical protein